MPTCLACVTRLVETGFDAVDRQHGTVGHFNVARCRNCGSGRTLPTVSEQEIATYYPRSYSPYEPAQRPVQRIISAVIRRWQGWRGLQRPPLAKLSSAPGRRALDVGCGRGDLGGYLVKQGWTVAGIEPSPEAADAARAQGVAVLTGTTASVGLPPDSFDAVIFQQSLEHTEEPVADLERAFNALASGGIVAIGVPNFGGRQARIFRSRWFHLDVPRHRTHFTPRGLRVALESAGFTDVAVSTSTSAIGFAGSVQYRLAGRCLFPSGLSLRIAAGLSALTLPVAWLLDAGRLQGDILSATARRP